MSEEQNNNIRPVKIRVINPSPKKSLTLEQVKSQKPQAAKVGLLCSLICLAAYIFFLVDYLDLFIFLGALSSWKAVTLKVILFHTLVFLLPTFLYALICNRANPFDFLHKRNPLGVLCLVMGFPFAYLTAVLNVCLSIFSFKLGLVTETWRPAGEIGLFPKHPLIQILYLLIFCFLPAICHEVSIRQIFLHESLNSISEHTAVLISSLATGLLFFSWPDLLPYAALGLLVSFVFKRVGNCLPTILCHLSFNITYRFLLDKIDFLKLDTNASNYRGLESYFPLILKVLLSASVFVPLFIIFSQVTKVNPLLAQKKGLRTKRKRSKTDTRLGYIATLGLVLLFILFAKR